MLSQALHAHFADTAEQRVSDRRVLQLEAQAATSDGAGEIRILNLSRTGMLVESAGELVVGTDIEVEMPGGARHQAAVVWRDAELLGCRFAKPLTQATLSAALLRAAPAVPPMTNPAVLVDSDAIDRLRQHWNFEHEIVDASDTRLPLTMRAWTVIGLGLASWAVPSALVAWFLA